jgi:hypothetical protein
MRYLVGLSLLVLFQGCTTSLKSKQMSLDDSAIPNGVIYYLPATTIEANLSFLPTSCFDSGDGSVVFGFEVSDAQVKQRYTPDPSEIHTLDYSALNSPMKITTANIVMYPSGMIKSINAEMDDRTAQVMASVAGTAVNLAKAGAFPSLIGVSAVPTATPCPKFVDDRLKLLNDLRGKVVEARAADGQYQDKLDELAKAQLDLDKAKVKLDSAPKDTSTSVLEGLKVDVRLKQQTVDRLSTALKDQKPKLPAAQAALAKITKMLTALASSAFTPTLKEYCHTVAVKISDYLMQYADDTLKPDEYAALTQFKERTFNPGQFQGKVCVNAEGEARKTAQSSATPLGLVYRVPQMARVTVSHGDSNSITAFTGESWISVPQYGSKAALPLENGAFDKNTLKLAFSEDGSLASLDFTAQAAAERGAAAMQDLSKSYVDVLSEREKARKAREQAQDDATKKQLDDQIAGYDAQIKTIQKQRELEVARSGIKDRTQIQIDATAQEIELIGKKTELEKKLQEYEKVKNQKP